VVAEGIISLGIGSLTLTTAEVLTEAVSGGNIELNENAYLNITSNTPFINNVAIKLNSGLSWIRTLNLKVADILNNHIGQIKVNNETAIYTYNLRLDNYYHDGTVIRSNDVTAEPLTIYDNKNLQGSSTKISTNVVHSGLGIRDNMDDKTESFILKKGFMVSFADNGDGTGKSKNYIASQEDLVVNKLPSFLQNNISFIRVIPWNWVTKKGVSSATIELNNSWNYQWNNTGTSSLSREYVPMSWGAGGANDDTDIELYKTKYKATHVMGFNESDNCNDQSGQFNNLCQTDVAVGYYKNLMKTGLRLVSPSCRENAPFGWLKDFYDKATAQDVRIDVIGVHWYDWGSNPINSPNADPEVVFNRFKKYLEDVHDLYKLPIWITEFNANPNRSAFSNYGFMQLVLPYLESLDYVERYCWFQPSSGVANYYNASGNTLTSVGNFYNVQVSTPSIPKPTVSEDSNLDIYYDDSSPTSDEYKLFNVITFPNPVHNILRIKAYETIESCELYDILGKLIRIEKSINSPLMEVNVQNQKPGTYFLILKGKNGMFSKSKIVIN
jgi:hypothetical protein